MRKITITTSFLIVVTLFMTQLATAQWKHNLVTNDSSNTVLVTFATYQPKEGQIPEGWRTMGWYRINPGNSRPFQAFGDYPIYYLVFHGGNFLQPDDPSIKRITSWMSRKPFIIVLNGETGTDPGIMYTYGPRSELVENSNFFRSDNGTPITVTSDRKVIVGRELTGLEKPELTISSGTGGTTLNQGSTRKLTISVREGGQALTNRQLFLTLSKETATLNPNTGRTDNNGQFETTLTANKDSSPGTFDVTAQLVGTDSSETLSFTIEIGPGQISISRSHSTVEPGRSTTLTITVLTPNGDPFPGAQISLSAPAGTVNPTLVTTKDNGKATSTWKAPEYTGTPHPNTIVDPPITATVVDNPKVTKQVRIPVRYIPGTVTISGVPSNEDVISGNPVPIIAKVLSSVSKSEMSGVTLLFDDKGSSYIQFAHSSVKTGSKGTASNTIKTGGQLEDVSFTVKVSGRTSISATGQVDIKPFTETDTKRFHITSDSAPCKRRVLGVCYSWNTNLVEWSKSVSFPGRVLEATVDGDLDTSDVALGGEGDVTGKSISGRTVTVRGVIERHVKIPNDIRGTVWARYEAVAGRPGAPPLQPQRTPEIDLLPSVWEDLSQVPLETALLPNYPNPFNPETWIPYHLAEPANVILTIYSADGRLVRTLTLGHQSAGVYESKSRAAYWDGRNAIGERVASGLYFYTLTAGDFAATGKMLIMK